MSPSNYASRPSLVPPRLIPLMNYLLEAINYAEQTEADQWDFAVERECLTAMGSTLNDLRWLVKTRLVTQQTEVTADSDIGRQFQPTGNLTFPDRTCFVLTTEGIRIAKLLSGWQSPWEGDRSICIDRSVIHGSVIISEESSAFMMSPSTTAKPHWDANRRLLQFNGTLVKHFKWIALNQEAVLSAFEEDGWSPRIDDPLPPHADQDPKRRLSDTIKCLNRKQDNAIVHFRGDGTGEGVVWELVQ